MVERLTIVGMQANNADEPDKTRRERRGTRWLFVKGRLAPGASAEEAQAQVSTVFARLEQEYPNTNEDMKAAVLGRSSVRFHPMVDNILATAGAVLLAAVGMILMIACANVANMLLARAANRSREIAVRLSVGASRGRLVRQLMTESLMLATLGGVMGVALAYWAARVLSVAKPPLPIPIEFAYELDTSVMAFAFFVSLATAVLFGLVPAFRASRPNLVPALKGEGIGIDDPTKRRFTSSNALVVGQLAVSLVLLVAGALLTRGFIEAQRTDVGFDASRVATLGFNLQMNNYSLEKAQALQRQLLERSTRAPGCSVRHAREPHAARPKHPHGRYFRARDPSDGGRHRATRRRLCRRGLLARDWHPDRSGAGFRRTGSRRRSARPYRERDDGRALLAGKKRRASSSTLAALKATLPRSLA